MTIRASAAREIERLTADLRDGSGVQRDAAIARLRIIGARAVGRLSELLAAAGTPAAARTAALRVLEGIDDPQAADLALRAAADEDAAVAAAAIGVLRGWVARESGTRVVDVLSALALDVARDPTVRLAALDALSELPRHIVQPLLQEVPPALGEIRDSVAAPDSTADPLSAREWLAAHARAPLSELHEFVRLVRERERQETSARARQDWRVARGAAHLVLARRGSRVALYDLREAFDAADGPLPLDFLTAVAAIGDADCLEPMARAWAAAPDDRWWRDRLCDAAAGILGRLGLNGRNAVVRRVRARWPGFL
jgi:hypothetical protein